MTAAKSFDDAVTEFEVAREAMESFVTENSQFVEQYDKLRDAFNSALSRVKAEYAANHSLIGKRYGDFYTIQKKEIDVELLVQRMGSAVDPIVEVTYKLTSRKDYDKAVNLGIIPPEVVAEVEELKDPEVRGPKAL